MRLRVLVLLVLFYSVVRAAPATSTDVEQRRGAVIGGTGTAAPSLTLTQPPGGWTTGMQVLVAGTCSDQTASPVEVNINGVRYYSRLQNGAFSKSFPVAPNKNNLVVTCRNKGGEARETRNFFATVNPIRLKFVLTSDTDNVYTDLHIYEPDGTHVYWASTESPSGGIFYLNNQGQSFDQPGYGPYLYVHPSPPIGVYRIDTNYWPGGAVRHTLATLDVVIDEGLEKEERRRVQAPLARPNETRTLAYVVVKPNREPPVLYIPDQDPESKMPLEVKRYKTEVEPKIKSPGDEYAFLRPDDEKAMRASVALIALAQNRSFSPLWEGKQRDCAGLVRFAYRQALSPRSETQLRKIGLPPPLFPPTVSEFARRSNPYYSLLWKVTGDTYDSFADAETLVQLNFRRLSGDPESARPADLLVFYNPTLAQSPYHVMIVAHDRSATAVYHNGNQGRGGGVRVVTLQDLYAASDPDWIPAAQNPRFLGVYRWNKFEPNRIEAGAA